MIGGFGAYEFTNVTPAPSTAKPVAADSHHKNVPNGCVACHVSLASGQNHSFKANIKACKSCHASLTTFDRDSVQTKVSKLIAETQDSLISRGIIVLDAASNIGVSVASAATTKKFPKAVVGAASNFLMVLNDGSKGVHNSDYTLYLLNNSLEQLKK